MSSSSSKELWIWMTIQQMTRFATEASHNHLIKLQPLTDPGLTFGGFLSQGSPNAWLPSLPWFTTSFSWGISSMSFLRNHLQRYFFFHTWKCLHGIDSWACTELRLETMFLRVLKTVLPYHNTQGCKFEEPEAILLLNSSVS